MDTTNKDASDHDTCYVLITGANSGLGYAICARLITEFLLTRPASSHLHILPTARSRSKADDTVDRLTAHIDNLGAGRCKQTPYVLHRSSGQAAGIAVGARRLFRVRVTIDPVVFDLSSLASVIAAAATVAGRVPRLDVVICNAGIGGWAGIDWLAAIKQTLTEGFIQAISQPKFQRVIVGGRNQLQMQTSVCDSGTNDSSEPILGQVFCANVFGHYILVHELASLLSRSAVQHQAPQGRVIWISTNQCRASHLRLDDIQGLEALLPYESGKRLTDMLVLGTQTKPTKSIVARYLVPSDKHAESSIEQSMVIVPSHDETSPPPTTNYTPPMMLLAHPGICQTSILPLHFLLVWGQLLAFYLARLLGSEEHVISAYKGAVAPVWLALATDEALQTEQADHAKWGSKCDRWGTEGLYKTPVDGWGLYGEKAESGDFGETADAAWTALEGLRHEWTDRIAKA